MGLIQAAIVEKKENYPCSAKRRRNMAIWKLNKRHSHIYWIYTFTCLLYNLGEINNNPTLPSGVMFPASYK